VGQLTGSVGDAEAGADNNALDIYRVQQRLRYLGFPATAPKPPNATSTYAKGHKDLVAAPVNGTTSQVIPPLGVTGKMDASTLWAIRLFEAAVNGNPASVNVANQDGVITRSGEVARWLSAVNAPVWKVINPGPFTGFYPNQPAWKDWGTQWIDNLLQTVGTNLSAADAAYAAQSPIGNVSLDTGGTFPITAHSAHASHQKGVDFDVDVPVIVEGVGVGNHLFFKWYNQPGPLYGFVYGQLVDLNAPDPSSVFQDGVVWRKLGTNDVFAVRPQSVTMITTTGPWAGWEPLQAYQLVANDDSAEELLTALYQQHLLVYDPAYLALRPQLQRQFAALIQAGNTAQNATVSAIWFDEPYFFVDNNLGGVVQWQPGHNGHYHVRLVRPTRIDPPQQVVTADEAGATAPSEAGGLTASALAPIVAEARALWAAAGLTPQQLARLDGATVGVAPLPAGDLGLTLGSSVTISPDAAGDGWFIDPTPADNSEFANVIAPGAQLQATPDSPAFGKVDLLTVVEHGLGHVLGLPHANPLAHPYDLMSPSLAPGARRFPQPGDVPGSVLVGNGSASWTPSPLVLADGVGSDVTAVAAQGGTAAPFASADDDPSSSSTTPPGFGPDWAVRGGGSVDGDTIRLIEDARVTSGTSRTFVVPDGATALRPAPLYALPPDGTWVEYDWSHWPRPGEEVKGTLRLSALGRAEVDKEACRWVEIKLVTGKGDAARVRLRKLLVAEKALRDGPPFADAVRQCFERDGDAVKPVTGRAARDFLGMGVRDGPLREKARDEVIETKLGKLSTRHVATGGEAGAGRDYDGWLSDKVPFGCARFEIREATDKGAARLVFRAVASRSGDGAVSELNEAKAK
jgi:hypothetical protein